jgi:hypothetical protein
MSTDVYVLTDPRQDYEETTVVHGAFLSLDEAQAAEAELRSPADIVSVDPDGKTTWVDAILMNRVSEIVQYRGTEIVQRWHGERAMINADENPWDPDDQIWTTRTEWAESKTAVQW